MLKNRRLYFFDALNCIDVSKEVNVGMTDWGREVVSSGKDCDPLYEEKNTLDEINASK